MTNIEKKLSQIPKINPLVKELSSTRGFISLFEGLVADGLSYRAAYERLEETHVRVIGKRKYSDFQSFKSIFYRICNSRRKK